MSVTGWSESYVSASSLVGALTGGTPLNLGPSGNSLKIALFDNTVTPNADASPDEYGSGAWAAGECTGTNWPSGGVALSLSGNGLTHQSGGIAKFQAGNVSVANTTISDAVQGALIYDVTETGLVVCAVWFGGSGYTTSAGILGITWPASGIFTTVFSMGG